MSAKSLRQRVTPSCPLQLLVKNEDGSSFALSFRLCFDFNALACVEEKTGLSMLDGEIFQNLTVSKISILLWAAAQIHNPEYEGEIGLHALRSYLDFDNVKEAQAAITEAFIISLPKDQADSIRRSMAEEDKPTEAPLEKEQAST